MGVQGLWVLLEPVGRRVNIETLTNKRLAVDASIWIYQFMQTMRDSQGEMLRNAHLVGFLRRICRLLFHRVRPVFVFDGATPPLKRRTIIARRRRREQQTAKVRKTAEKLLLAQLKKYALQTGLQGGAIKAAAAALQEQPGSTDTDGVNASGSFADVEAGPSQLPDTSGDAMLAQQLAAEMQRGSYAQDLASHVEAGDAEAVGRLALEAVEAMTSTLPIIKEEEEYDDEEDEDAGADEEVSLPEGMELDPVVMSTLPPSMQLDLLTKMRENKIYENREKFARHANQPASFSSLQMQEYLKASAFRRKIEDVKDALNASAAAGGAVAKRIAGEEGREYILQRHNTGEKQQLSADTPSQQTDAKAVAAGSNVEISLDLAGTGGLDINDLLLKSPQEQKQEVSSEEEWENVDTGEPVSETKVPSTTKRPADWRERKAQRQKYWSLSQGFRFGRKLAEWGGLDGDTGEEGNGGSVPGVDDTEDSQMQEAIRRSILDAPGRLSTRQQGSRLRAATTAAQNSEDESEQIWHRAQASDARPSRGIEAGSSAGPSGAGQSNQIPSRINELSARRLEAPSNATAPPAAGIVNKGLRPGGSNQAELAKAANSSKAVNNGHDRQENSHASNGTQLKAYAAGSASAAALTKALQTAEEEVVILDDVEEECHSAPEQPTAHALDNGRRKAKATAAAAPNIIFDSSGPRAASARHQPGRMVAVEAPSCQVGAVGTSPAPAGGAAIGLGFFGAQRPMLERDPEDKMPLIPVLLGSKAAPALTAKKEEDTSVPEQGVSKLVPAESQTAAVNPLDPLDRSSLRQQQLQHTLPTGKESAVAVPAGDAIAAASSADGVHKQHINGTTAAPLVSVQDQTGPGAPSPHEHAQAYADEDNRMQEEHEEDNAPVQYSRDPWAHDLWGQGDLWEDPEQGKSILASEATTAGISAVLPQLPLPAQAEEPVVDPPAFDLEQELAQLEKETKTLRAANKRTAGTNEAPTTDMHGDCQELLQLFGLPYIIAPSEAEAQCAWLDANGLVDGVVTDDNDVFLFGAKHVYRHIFENRKYVEEYRTDDVERELGLDQEGLIRLALLLGSDYTEGVGGIGIVNAVETVRAFRGEDGMRKFRDWVMNPDEEELLAAVRPQRKRKRKKQVKAGDERVEAEEEADEAVPDPYVGEDPEIAEYKRKHRNMRKNWELPPSFPDARVIEAYRKASVDDSKERFTHGRPDAELLRNFCKEKFNWGPDKVDEILEPVLKAYDARQAQLTMDTFLTFNERFAKIKSKRLAKAVKGISKATHPELLLEDDVDEPAPKPRRASKQAPSAATEQQQLGVFRDKSESDEELLAAIEAVDPSAQQPVHGRGRGGRGMQKQGGRQGTSRRGRGRGRGGGRGRGQAKEHLAGC